MSDDTTEALNRIAAALELHTHMNAYRTYADDAEHYTNMADLIKGEESKKIFMEYAEKNYSRAVHLSQRIDKLTGYQEDA